MKSHKTSYLIALISFCFLSILAFQVYWLQVSKNTIEAQFNQKVSLALSAAVGKLEGCTAEECAMKNECCEASGSNELSFKSACLHKGHINQGALEEAIKDAFVFYDLPQEFEVSLLESCDLDCDPSKPNCCALGPFNAENDQFINIVFPNRKAYVRDKMWLMLVSSILILAFILFVFLLTIRSLLNQQRIATFNKDFFNNMAHEFRTPLANIHLAVKRLKGKHDELRENTYINIIDAENSKLNANVERVLSLAKMDNGQYELRKEQVSVQHLLDEIVADMALIITEAKAKVHIDSSVSQFKIWADPLHLSHAFRNLIDNAIKYCEVDPQISVSMQEVEDGVSLIFEDNGVGIDEDQKKLVFDRFARVGEEDGVKGYGLGLSYVKMIVELHKGRIKLFSQAGQGSRFELYLPTTT